MKKKIVFLIRDLDYGGAQRQLVTLVKGLDKHSFDVTVLYFYSGGPLEKDLRDSGIPTISLEKQGRWDLIRFFRRLIQHLQQINPNVLHGYLGESNLLTIFLKPFFPATYMIWGIRDSKTDAALYGWLGSLIFKIGCVLSRFADLIVINSHAGRKFYLNQGFPGNKMVVIPNGIDTERFQPDREAGARVRKEWGISEDAILIGLVARLNPMKDHPTFLKTAALLCKERQDVRFVCVGTGLENYALQLYQLAEQLGISDKVIWAGARADMCAVHNALDVAVSASAYGEGFSNVIGEAMACGIPCVVTDVGDSAWIVGDTGIVVPPTNPEALATGCRSLIALTLPERNVLQEKARIKILENFSVYKVVVTTQLFLKCN